MQEVFVLYSDRGGEYGKLIGIFSTKERAEAAKKAYHFMSRNSMYIETELVK